MPALNKASAKALRDANRIEGVRDLVKPAEAVDRARRYLAVNTPEAKKQSISAYQSVIQRFAGTGAAEVAKKELAEIAPSSASLTTGPGSPAPKYRQWTDSTGKYKTEAVLIEFKNGKVRLKKKDGKFVVLPLSRLSAEDQAFLKNPG